MPMRKLAIIGVVILIVCGTILSFGGKLDFGIIAPEAKAPSQESDHRLKNIALDNREIYLDAKKVVIIFGSNDCLSCDKLKNSIHNTPSLVNKLKNNFALYYINMNHPKRHKIFAKDNLEIPNELSTSSLARMYRVYSTPTIVFIAPNGQEIFAYNGFMQPERFLVTLEFFENEQIQNLTYDDMLRKLFMMYEQKGV